MTDTIVAEIKKTIKPVYAPNLEKEIYKSLISQFYHQNTDELEVEKILTELYNSIEKHDIPLSEIIKTKDKMYLGEIEPNSGIDGISKLLAIETDEKTSKSICKELKQLLTPYDTNKVLTLSLSDTRKIKLDLAKCEINILSIKYNVKGKDNSEYLRIISAYPSKIIIHDNPISTQGRTFTIYWITKNGGHFITDSMLIPEIETYLENHGYVLSPRQLKGTIAGIIELAIENEIAIIKNEIETPGFYWNAEHERVDIINFEYKKPPIESLNKSLDLIEDLKPFFKGQEKKLATTLKHGLVAPFGFAKKQMGQSLELLIPYIYHFGKGGSGKTTLAQIILYFWGGPTNENDLGGTDADTLPRLGQQISKFTFPININEPDAIFSKRTLKEAMKTSVERTNARSKFDGKNFINILALSTIQFTSNYALPNEEGLNRRFIQLLYSHSEKKTDGEKEAFNKKFNIDQPDICKFQDLHYLADFCVDYIVRNPEVLRLNWEELSNKIIMQAYISCGRTVPVWLLEFVESVTSDDLDDEETEELRMFFVDEINKQLHKVNADEYESPADINKSVKSASDFHRRVFNVINERLIPYMGIHHNKRRDKYYVFCTSGLKKALHNVNQVCYDVKSIAELLEWDYKAVRIPKSTKVMIVSFDKFIKFLYPSIDDLEDGD